MRKVSRHPLLMGTLLAICGLGVLYGCKDFLSSAAAPQGTLDESTLANRAGVEGSLVAAYRSLDCTTSTSANWGCAASNWVWGSVTSDDAYKGSEASDQPAINDIEGLHWATGDAESYLNDKWTAMYEGVVRANSTLRLLKKVKADSPTEITDVNAKGIEGEALFLRAHYHFEAYRLWGAIPYYREDDTDFRKANLAATAVPAEIIKDLDAAIALLAPTPRNNQKGRATSWTAKAYKGKVQMYAGQFAAALTTLREVQASNVYALEDSYDRVWTGVKELENGKETILAYQASANDGEPDGNNANFGERLNFPHSGSPLSCCGFHQGSQNLVNFFQVNAAGLPLSLTDPNWNARNDTLTSSSPTIALDPRIDYTVGRDGVPYKDWGLHQLTWIRSFAYGGFYSSKKNVHEKSSGAQSNVGWTNTQLNSVNMHIFRYADALLLLAEAEVEAGSLVNATNIVNQIRTRAGKTAQGCGASGNDVATEYPTCTNDGRIAVPINDASIKWATYRVGLYPVFASQTEGRTAVRNERRLELAMEGQRFFDLRRWGIDVTTMNAYLTVEKSRRGYLIGADAYTARHHWFPIPAIQIELSKVGGTSRLTQNTGW